MPALVTRVTIYLHELFENGATTSGAFRRKSSRIMKVAVNIAIVFVIRVLGTEESWAKGAGKVFDVKLLIWNSSSPKAPRL